MNLPTESDADPDNDTRANDSPAQASFAGDTGQLPMDTRRVLVQLLLVGIVYMLSTLLADLLIAFLNPRVRLETTR